jgi:dTDP-4-dehydrorhamnose reductase
VVGASGYVGRHLARHAAALGDTVTGTFRSTRPEDRADVAWRALDVTDADAVDALVASVAPDAVVSSAYGRGAGGDWAVNARGAVTVALAAKHHGVRLVHVSSDAVHSGRPEPIDESVPPAPVHPYGAAKAAAELAIASVLPTAVLARVSLVQSDGAGEPSTRELFMRDLATGRTAGVLYTDDVRCPIAVTDLAGALRELAGSTVTGVVNLAGPDAVSFHELGVLVARHAGLDPGALPASTAAAAGVVRPGDVRLDTSLARRILRTRLRGIREVLDES